MGLSRSISEIDGDFSRKMQNIPTPLSNQITSNHIYYILAAMRLDQ